MDIIYIIENREYDDGFKIEYAGTTMPFDVFYKYYKNVFNELHIWKKGRFIGSVSLRADIRSLQNCLLATEYNFLKSLFDQACEKLTLEDSEKQKKFEKYFEERELSELRRLMRKYKDRINDYQ